MNGRIRPGQLQDLGAIDRLFNESSRNGVAGKDPLRWPQFPSVRLWSLLSRSISSILPIAAPADHLYVSEEDQRIRGFVQAEVGAAGRHVWHILNLCLTEEARAAGVGSDLLDRLFAEGLKRGVTKYLVRIPLDDPILSTFREKGFGQYAVEHVLFAEAVSATAVQPPAGLRKAHSKDVLALYLLYRATTPKPVVAVEGGSMQEWRATFQQGALARLGRAGHTHHVLDRGELRGWIGLAAGSSTRPHTLGLLVPGKVEDESAALVDYALGQLAERYPGPVWCHLREYDSHLIRLLTQRRFEILASQALLVRELPLKVRVKVKAKDKKLVPQFG